MTPFRRERQREELQAMGRKALALKQQGYTLREIALELDRPATDAPTIRRALQAIGYPDNTQRYLNQTITQFEADGRKAVQFLDDGHSMADALMAIGGSRARLYRAVESVAPGRLAIVRKAAGAAAKAALFEALERTRARARVKKAASEPIDPMLL